MKALACLPKGCCLAFVLALWLSFPAFSQAAEELSRDQLILLQEEAVAQAEKNNLASEDPLNIFPRLRDARTLIDQGSRAEGQVMLEQVVQDLRLWESLSRKSGDTQKLRWLETYWDILQKFAFLALIAFLFTRRTSWRKALKHKHLPVPSRLLLALLTTLLAALFWGLDVYRYGTSVFAFFDIRIVLLTVGGLLGGWLVSMPAALLLGGLAVLMGDLNPWPLGLMSITAIGSGIISLKIMHYERSVKAALGCGLGIGLIHGAVVYIPSAQILPPVFMAMSILLLAGLETAGVVLFFAVVSAVLREDIRRDTEHELLRTRLLFLQAQLRPHFLFNALNTIADVCHRASNDVGEKLILKLSEFLRHSIDRKEEAASFREEMAFMDAYLEIEKARFGESLKIEKALDLPESLWELKVPLLIFQPLVENAVRHGLRKKTGGGTLLVKAAFKEGCLWVEISDNGAGKPAEFFDDLISGKATEVEGTGIGVRNIHERLVRFYGAGHGLQYETSPSRGTRVTVRIPVSGKGVT